MFDSSRPQNATLTALATSIGLLLGACHPAPPQAPHSTHQLTAQAGQEQGAVGPIASAAPTAGAQLAAQGIRLKSPEELFGPQRRAPESVHDELSRALPELMQHRFGIAYDLDEAGKLTGFQIAGRPVSPYEAAQHIAARCVELSTQLAEAKRSVSAKYNTAKQRYAINRASLSVDERVSVDIQMRAMETIYRSFLRRADKLQRLGDCVR